MHITKQNNFTSLKSFFSDRLGADRTKTLSVLTDHLKSSNDFIILWGASNKKKATKADKDCLLYLFHFLKKVEDLFFIKTNLTFIFTDTHAYLNGYDSNIYNEYINDIKYHIRKHNFNYEYSSNLCEKKIAEIGFKDYMNFINVIIDSPVEYFDKLIGDNENVLATKNFYPYAEKHCNRIKEHISGRYFKDSISAAKAYLSFAIFEKEIITEKFKNSAFITYMSREEEFALPNLPIVRIYSIKSGLRTRPWFIYE